MNKDLCSRFLTLLIIVIVGACAKISAPTGGMRDRQPPVVLKSVPEKAAKNFRGKSITITFDEYVVLDNITDKFMISPPTKKKPRVLTKGKSVVIEFEDKLKDSTTYTCYFQDAIKDLNEGNILDDYQFVFSTGPVIDSLSVTGNVYNAFDLEVPEKTQVLMYRELADSAVKKHIPEYISRVDPTGYFRINNVRPGKYRLYALKDDDNSKSYNRVEEDFAFLDTLVTITTGTNYIPPVKDTTTVKKMIPKIVSKLPPAGPAKEVVPVILTGQYKLLLFKGSKKDHYLTKSARDTKYLLLYTLSLPPDSMKFSFSIPGVGADKYLIQESRTRDSIKVWITDSTLFSQELISTVVKYPFTDSLGVVGYKQDSIPMRFITPRAPRVARLKKAGLLIESNLSGGLLKPGQSIVFKTQTPFRQADTTRIKLYELIQTNKRRVAYQMVKDSSNLGKYILKANLLQGKKYLLIAESASFGNIYRENSDSLGIKFSLKDPELYSTLTLNIKNCTGDCIIQLLNNTENLISEIKINKDGKYDFPLLENGIYRVKVIYDLNHDGKWTTGDFDIHRQPEPVSYLAKELEYKTVWTLIEDWDIAKKYFKEQKLRQKPKTR